jgi:hypothetical protein
LGATLQNGELVGYPLQIIREARSCGSAQYHMRVRTAEVGVNQEHPSFLLPGQDAS